MEQNDKGPIDSRVLPLWRSRLLHVYAAGDRLLGDAELVKLAALLPDRLLIERRMTKARYTKSQEDYAAQYGYAVRNIKKWIGLGREKSPPDLPPLDQPELMASWWTRNMKQRVPPRLLLSKPKPEAKPSDQGKPAVALKPPSQPSPESEDALKGTGYAAMLNRVNHAELVAWEMWQTALTADPFEPSDEEMRRRAYDRASEQARKVLKDRDSGLAGDDEWGRWEEFELLAQEHVSVLNQSLRSLAVRVATKMALPPETFRRMGDAMNEELDRIFMQLDRVNWRQAVDSDHPDENFQLAAQ